MKNTFKETCVALRKKGYTITQIVRETGRPKTSVYAHIRNLPLSNIRQQELRKQAGERIRAYSLARKGKSSREFKRIVDWTPESVLLIAHLYFDGEIARGKCHYHNRNTALISRVSTLMSKWYKHKPKHYENSFTRVQRICYHNVELGAHMRQKAEHLLSEIRSLPRECKWSFLKAFFDDKGCMDYRPNRGQRSVRGYQKKVEVLQIVKDLLRDFDIDSRIVQPNEIAIVGKENLKRFKEEIGFSKGVTVNGGRKNSIWGKNIEKRKLLNMAVASYAS